MAKAKAKESVGSRLRRFFKDRLDEGRRVGKLQDVEAKRWNDRNAKLRLEVKRLLDKLIGDTYEGFSLNIECGGGATSLHIWIRTVEALDHVKELHRRLHVDVIQVCYRSRVRWPK